MLTQFVGFCFGLAAPNVVQKRAACTEEGAPPGFEEATLRHRPIARQSRLTAIVRHELSFVTYATD